MLIDLWAQSSKHSDHLVQDLVVQGRNNISKMSAEEQGSTDIVHWSDPTTTQLVLYVHCKYTCTTNEGISLPLAPIMMKH